MSCGIGHRRSSDPALLWLWYRLVAPALMRTSICHRCCPKETKRQNKTKTNKVGSSHCGTVEMNLIGIHEDACPIPGLAQWIRDPALPWAVVEIEDAAQIWCGYGCGIGWQGSDLTPSLGTFISCWCGTKKQKQNKTRQNNKVGDPHDTGKPEKILYILAYVTTLLLIGISTVIVPVWPHRFKYSLTNYEGGDNDVSMTSTPLEKEEEAVLSLSLLSLDYKNVAHLLLRAEPSHLPACLPHKCPILNLFLADHFASRWIPFVLRHVEPEPRYV